MAVGEAFGANGEAFDEAGSPGFELLAVGGVGGEIVLLVGVVVQVEQEFAAIFGTPDVFQVAIGQGMECLIRAVAWGVLAVQPGADRRGVATQDRGEGEAVHRRGLGAGEVEHCGEDVFEADWLRGTQGGTEV